MITTNVETLAVERLAENHRSGYIDPYNEMTPDEEAKILRVVRASLHLADRVNRGDVTGYELRALRSFDGLDIDEYGDEVDDPDAIRAWIRDPDLCEGTSRGRDAGTLVTAHRDLDEWSNDGQWEEHLSTIWVAVPGPDTGGEAIWFYKVERGFPNDVVDVVNDDGWTTPQEWTDALVAYVEHLGLVTDLWNSDHYDPDAPEYAEQAAVWAEVTA